MYKYIQPIPRFYYKRTFIHKKKNNNKNLGLSKKNVYTHGEKICINQLFLNIYVSIIRTFEKLNLNSKNSRFWVLSGIQFQVHVDFVFCGSDLAFF